MGSMHVPAYLESGVGGRVLLHGVVLCDALARLERLCVLLESSRGLGSDRDDDVRAELHQ